MLPVELTSLLLLCCSAAAGHQVTTVRPRDDATLKYLCPSHAAITLLEWVRSDLESDGYVFFYRNNRLYENYQHPSFRGRVELKDPEMKDGDVSVTLKNVTASDAGTYNCRITSSKTENDERLTVEFSSHVSLIITDEGHSAALRSADENENEGDNGGGKEDDDKRVRLLAGLSALLRSPDGTENGGDNGGGKEDGNKRVGLLAGGTTLGILLIIGVVFLINDKLLNKCTCVSYHAAAKADNIKV